MFDIKYSKIDRQKKWEVLIVQGSKVLNMFTFENNYDIGEGIENIVNTGKNMPCIDFNSAKRKYFSLFSIEELIEM